MAFRTWGRLLLTALGVSVLAGAGQLGIAYGFGIVRLTGAFTDVNRWPAQLAWVGWFAVTAAVVGAVVTVRLARRDGLPAGTGVPLAVSGAAALGATVVAPLCMQPARAAELSTVDPVWAVGICAVVGAVIGAGAASAVLLRPPLGWNVALLVGAVWLIALVSVAPALLSAGPPRSVRLGVLEPSWLDADAAQRLAMLVLPAVALLAGAATGRLARRRGHVPLISGGAGAAGPVLLAFAYLTAGPGDSVDRYQLAPYYGAVIAVAAGALGSAAAALLRWPIFAATGADAAVEPTDILRPLPHAPALSAASGEGPTTVDLAGVVGAATSPGYGTPPGPGRTGEPTPAHWDWPVTPGTPTTAPAPSGTRLDAGFALDAPATEPVSASWDEPSGRGPEEPSDGDLPVGEPSDGDLPVGGSRAAEGDPPAATPAGAPQPRDRRTTPAESPRASEPAAPATEPSPATTWAAEPADTAAAVTPGPRPKRTRKPRSARSDEPADAVSPTTAPTPLDTAGLDTAGLDTAGLDTPAGRTPASAGTGATPAADERAPRPRHQLPDLNSAVSWNAFAAPRPAPAPPRAELPFPDHDPDEEPKPVTFRWNAGDSRPGTPRTPGRAADLPAAEVPGSTVDARPAEPAAGNSRPKRGLFRRNKAPGPEQPAEAPEAEPLAVQDEEYVDWVTGLSRPLADNEPETERGRRSLRSTGRHHRD
ncbi:hypothetical protein ABZ807_27080 [Micromonospora sp. NPDC047548]|uniref:hypothetical protein n=1 Tax=Micromonospora sp. NPDC047548 TaxID=3155624 RepID=UPI003403B4AC